MLRYQHDTNSADDYSALAMPRTYNRASLQKATRGVTDMWCDLRSFVQEV